MPRPTKPWSTVPLSPVTPLDDRPAICDLLEKHSDDIDSIRKIVSEGNPLYNTDYHDDLWLLRFLLSQKTSSRAAKAALSTMEYRSKHGLDAQDQLGWMEPPTPGQSMPKTFSHYVIRMEEDTVFHAQPHGDRGVFNYVCIAGVDMKRMSKEVTKDEMRATLRVTNEFYFRVLDEVTRRTGRLTKLVRIYDLEGLTYAGLDHSFIQLEGQVAKEIEDFYPQLLGSVAVFNVPKVLESLWRMFKYFFPVRTREKVEIYAPLNDCALPKDARIFHYISPSNLPKKYGGQSMNWPPPDGSFGPPGGEEFVGGLQTYHSLDSELLVKH